MTPRRQLRPYYAREGWADRYRVREVFAAAVELTVFVLLLVALFGIVLLTAAATDSLPR